MDERVRPAKMRRTTKIMTEEKEKSYPTTAKGKFDKVEELVRGLISAYTPQPTPSNVPSTQVSNAVSVKNDPWAEWDQQLNHDLQAQRTTEFDRYLDETPVPRSSDFDIMKWWMGNELKYPVLSSIARDLLAVPASSVASESAFSIAEKTISDFRSSLTPKTVEALICTQDWYRTEDSTEFSTAAVDDLIMEEVED